jgi:hypothetical protein
MLSCQRIREASEVETVVCLSQIVVRPRLARSYLGAFARRLGSSSAWRRLKAPSSTFVHSQRQPIPAFLSYRRPLAKRIVRETVGNTGALSAQLGKERPKTGFCYTFNVEAEHVMLGALYSPAHQCSQCSDDFGSRFGRRPPTSLSSRKVRT